MTLHSASLRREAAGLLDRAAYSPRRLVLIHTAVSLGASLLVGLFNLLFARLIANTGGLDGIGIRSALETTQAVVEMAVTIALPFWNIGLIRAALCWARGESAEIPTLLEGFRRFRSVLGVKLLTAVVFLAVGMAVANIASFLFMLTPFAAPLMEILEPILQESGSLDPQALLTEELMAQITTAAIPFMTFMGVIFAAIAIPIWYRIRFADFGVMEGKRSLLCLLESVRITRKKSLELFKLDLSFWWFYLLQALSVALCYGDSILTALGVTLPISAEAAYVVFYALGILCQGVLLWFYQAKVSATYALAYDALSSENTFVGEA